MARILRPRKAIRRSKWQRMAVHADRRHRKGGSALANHSWLAGQDYSLVDIAFFAMAAHMPMRFSDILNDEDVSPRTMDWHRRMMARPAAEAALAMPAPARS